VCAPLSCLRTLLRSAHLVFNFFSQSTWRNFAASGGATLSSSDGEGSSHFTCALQQAGPMSCETISHLRRNHSCLSLLCFGKSFENLPSVCCYSHVQTFLLRKSCARIVCLSHKTCRSVASLMPEQCLSSIGLDRVDIKKDVSNPFPRREKLRQSNDVD